MHSKHNKKQTRRLLGPILALVCGYHHSANWFINTSDAAHYHFDLRPRCICTAAHHIIKGLGDVFFYLVFAMTFMLNK